MQLAMGKKTTTTDSGPNLPSNLIVMGPPLRPVPSPPCAAPHEAIPSIQRTEADTVDGDTVIVFTNRIGGRVVLSDFDV